MVFTSFPVPFCVQKKMPLLGCRNGIFWIQGQFLQLTGGADLHSAGSPQKGCPLNKWQQFAIFLADLPIDFLGKLAEKIANADCTITRYLAIGQKYKLVVKHPKYWVIIWGLVRCFRMAMYIFLTFI